ncbi:hypothetical protein H1D32_12355 [Anaerobacillus sp. CMMVII]|uniref:hypothetical protein n=1 Tax=Anaerobacillus sp. CMMVII TaxID=2755588 RepID=UPI0021B7CEA8|nr:hypothetical protein [Anaerobacillus sp. CMMVII]MCT8138462.1 hypothetical protein [Anaerobacillus sp. CMMVII]
MKNSFIILIALLAITLLGCTQLNSKQTVPFGDKNLTKIVVYHNWETKILLPLNSVKLAAPLKSKIVIDEVAEMSLFIEAVENGDTLGPSHLIFYTAEYDVRLHFDDKTSSQYHLNLGNETEHAELEGLLIDPSENGVGYQIPVELTQELRKILN